MARTRFVFVLLALAMVASACQGRGLPTSPSPSPIPDQSLYPPLPHKECAKDLETGEELPGCRMWAELLSISPPRGSKVKIGPQWCPQPDPPWSCLEFEIRFGFTPSDPRFPGMGIIMYWSQDGKTPGEEVSLMYMQENEMVRHFGPWIFQTAPRYLLIRLAHAAGNSGGACDPTGCDPALLGWVSFFLDYKEG